MSSKRKILIIPLILIPVFATTYLLLREKPIEVSVFKVKKGDVEATITATTTGTVKAKAVSKISSQYMGKIARILRREGARVKKNETLVELENRDARAQVGLARANLRAAQADLNQLLLSKDIVTSQTSAMVNQTKSKLDSALANHSRAASLYPKGMISKQEMEDSRTLLDVARADYKNAKANELQEGMKDEEIKMAVARVDQMQANLEMAEVQLSRTYIKSPYPGVITELFVETGEILNVGTTVLELADESNMEVEAAIDEVDAGKLRLGQDVKLTFDAFKGKIFIGKIVKIYPLVTTTKEQNRTVNINVGINIVEEGIKVGMSMDVEVITGRVNNVLFIPTNSIIERSEGQFVYIYREGAARTRKIKTGLSNWETSEVVEGLKEGDEVITSLEIMKLKDGIKVVATKKD